MVHHSSESIPARIRHAMKLREIERHTGGACAMGGFRERRDNLCRFRCASSRKIRHSEIVLFGNRDDAILDAACEAWNKFIAQPRTIPAGSATVIAGWG